jgi:endonuclease V-like protein UPF0215 family
MESLPDTLVTVRADSALIVKLQKRKTRRIICFAELIPAGFNFKNISGIYKITLFPKLHAIRLEFHLPVSRNILSVIIVVTAGAES